MAQHVRFQALRSQGSRARGGFGERRSSGLGLGACNSILTNHCHWLLSREIPRATALAGRVRELSRLPSARTLYRTRPVWRDGSTDRLLCPTVQKWLQRNQVPRWTQELSSLKSRTSTYPGTPCTKKCAAATEITMLPRTRELG